MAIFRDDEDRQLFIDLLAEEISRSRWVLHDYALMGNHYHLKIETPECTLSTGMHRLLTRYVQRFNRRHRRRGHLFEGRFKNVLVEKESYAMELSRYIALNPVRAGLGARPEECRWSSYRARAGFERAPAWLSIDPLLSQLGSEREDQQREYRGFVLAGIGAEDDLEAKVVAQLYLGTPRWIDQIQVIVDDHERSEEHPRSQVHPGRPTLADVIDAVAATFDVRQDSICHSHGTLERQLVAYFAFEEGLVPLRQIGRVLGLTSASGVSALVKRSRAILKESDDVRSLAAACRSRMRRRPPPFLFPPMDRLTPARRYHRAPSHPQR